jgi:MFS family permease
MTMKNAFGDTFRSLRVRNFRLFFVGQFISMTGTWMTMVAQTLLALDLGASGITLGLLAACQFGPVLLAGPLAGAVADRVDKRRLLLLVQTGAMLQSAVLGLVVLTGNASIGLIFVLASIQGVLTAFDNPVRRSFVVEMVPIADVANAVSLNSTIMTGSRVVGPALAGVAIATIGYAWCFLLDAASYVAVIAGILVMRSSELFRSAPTPRAKGQIRDGLRYVWSQPHLRIPMVMMAIIGTFAFDFAVTLPLLVTGPLGGNKQSYTWLLSVISLGSVIGALATARRREVPPSHVVGSALLFGVGMLAIAVAPNLWIALPLALVTGLGAIGFMTSSTALIQLFGDPLFRGRVLALQSMVFLGTTPLGGPLVGWIADVMGPRAAVLVGGLACLAAAAWGRHAWRQVVQPIIGQAIIGQPINGQPDSTQRHIAAS